MCTDNVRKYVWICGDIRKQSWQGLTKIMLLQQLYSAWTLLIIGYLTTVRADKVYLIQVITVGHAGNVVTEKTDVAFDPFPSIGPHLSTMGAWVKVCSSNSSSCWRSLCYFLALLWFSLFWWCCFLTLLFFSFLLLLAFLFISKGPSTLGTQCALNQIESGLSASTLNAHSPNPDPIRIHPNPLPEVVSIQIELDCAIARCA